MCLVHDDGTILVQVRLPKRLPQENTVSHVLDERGLEGGWWRRGRKRRKREGEKRWERFTHAEREEEEKRGRGK